MNNSNDDRIKQQVTNKLTSRGLSSPCRVTVQASNGQVTLSGTVQYAHQKSAAMSAISGMTGVRRVIDQMTVKPMVKRTQ
jgi:osmotically-inducible protein OsmY